MNMINIYHHAILYYFWKYYHLRIAYVWKYIYEYDQYYHLVSLHDLQQLQYLLIFMNQTDLLYFWKYYHLRIAYIQIFV
jgi:hypothetical protein